MKISTEEAVRLANVAIDCWVESWGGPENVYVSFSGGKDSTVLLHLVRKRYPAVEAVFINTGLEYPEIVSFVKTIDNVTVIHPIMPFHKVIKKYGYPVISKEQAYFIHQYKSTKSEHLRNLRWNGRMAQSGSGRVCGKISEKWKYLVYAPFKIHSICCDKLKKRPIAVYEKRTGKRGMIGIMAADSSLRGLLTPKQCNIYNRKKPLSRPLFRWSEKNIWEYIRAEGIPYSKIYDMGYTRTGCMFCMFGVHLEKGENRFQRMRRTHPKQYEFCMNRLGLSGVLDFLGVDYE